MKQRTARIRYLQHVPFEGPAYIEAWARRGGHELKGTALYGDEPLPALSDFDCLVVLGGPMSVHDGKLYPWLADEERFIGTAIAAGKAVLGICLGAQLLAASLGAGVRKNEFKEIGWYPVRLTSVAHGHPLFAAFPAEFTAFHWHGETFGLPVGAARVASTEVCLNQAFVYGDRVVGLQFHLETTVEAVEALIADCGHELVAGDFIQNRRELVWADPGAAANILMSSLLDALIALPGS